MMNRVMRPLFLLLTCTMIAINVMRMNHTFYPSIVDESNDETEVSQYQSVSSSKPFIAIVSCIKYSDQFGQGPLEDILLPSIYATITQKERASYRIELILGYDHDDTYWSEEHNQKIIPKSYDGEQLYKDHSPIPINFVSIKKNPDGDRPNRIPFNELTQSAYDYGATYIVRINDDTEFKTPGWITIAAQTLASFSPPNLGVVGPTCKQGNEERFIMVHDCVHAPTHYSIFDTYYPQILDNYYVDDWISSVYGMGRTKQPKEWEVHHHLLAVGTRYAATYHQDKLLPALVKGGKKLVEKAIRYRKKKDWYTVDERRAKQKHEQRVLGTDTIVHVNGPMESLHLTLKGI